MCYLSTRGSAPELDFEGATLAGLASDGGLYVPAAWPRLSPADIAGLAGLSYVETAMRVCTPFIGQSLGEAELRAILTAAYASFGHAATVPLKALDERHWLLELFHGPTLAFKDVAMQALGGLFETFLGRTARQLTIIGATSGDTGSAAIHALAGRDRVQVFMLHPRGRVSEVQRRQMTTVLSPNIHNIAIDGTFDDAQALVKAMFNDRGFAARFDLGAVNSINWARLMLQIPYYFHAAVRLGAPERAVSFAVPTGNFGDVFAGYAARAMGLPIERLVVATNENDILHRALSAGDYSAGQVAPTDSPSMDIQVSSNFERLLFDLAGRDGTACAGMMAGFEARKALAIPGDQQAAAAAIFASERVDADAMRQALRWAATQCGEVIDPHTAVGLAAARRQATGTTPMVTLATAHPAKFPDAVERACGIRPALPAQARGLMDREERYSTLPAELAAIEAFIADRAAPRLAA
ncbi:threonine synthase [alpha proteobacterium AAP81b]|nr:threonine synthase [alpha proteobacterium AAP81b]